jgi:hypothetical protein
MENNNLFDKRIVDRNIQKGLVTKEQYQKFVKSLPDDESNAEWVSTTIEDSLETIQNP